MALLGNGSSIAPKTPTRLLQVPVWGFGGWGGGQGGAGRFKREGGRYARWPKSEAAYELRGAPLESEAPRLRTARGQGGALGQAHTGAGAARHAP
jgi:hypothetical protein